MSWHVLTGTYYMAYDSKAQPYNLYLKNDVEHRVVIAFKIRRALIGTDIPCDEMDGKPEVHVQVNDTTVAFAGKWAAGEAVFGAGGKARLYFDPGLPSLQKQRLELIFRGKASDPNLAEFGTIPDANWVTSMDFGAAVQYGSVTTPNGDGYAVTTPSGTLNFVPIVSRTADSSLYRLVNPFPRFRLGGQLLGSNIGGITRYRSVDTQGVNLAHPQNTTWTETNANIGNLVIDGPGEYRDFIWFGGPDLPVNLLSIGRDIPDGLDLETLLSDPRPDPDKGSFSPERL
jgi:hypothetical protein